MFLGQLDWIFQPKNKQTILKVEQSHRICTFGAHQTSGPIPLKKWVSVCFQTNSAVRLKYKHNTDQIHFFNMDQRHQSYQLFSYYRSDVDHYISVLAMEPCSRSSFVCATEEFLALTPLHTF